MLQRSATVLLVCSSATSAQLVQELIKASIIISFRSSVPSIGSIAAGCSLCLVSGNCSMAMNDTSSGVFCGDIHPTTAETQPCCCAYYTECRATSLTQTCECGRAWPFALRHERLPATEVVANETEARVRDRIIPDDDQLMDNQISVTTEIFIHLSAYLALFVFALYIDKWVECFSDFRRNHMVTYGKASDVRLLRFRQHLGKRRRDSQTDSDDNIPLLVVESSTPKARPAFTFDMIADAESSEQEYEKEEPTAMSRQVVVVTVPVDVVQETSINLPEEIPLE